MISLFKEKKFYIILDFNDLKKGFFDKKNGKFKAEVAYFDIKNVVFGV